MRRRVAAIGLALMACVGPRPSRRPPSQAHDVVSPPTPVAQAPRRAAPAVDPAADPVARLGFLWNTGYGDVEVLPQQRTLRRLVVDGYPVEVEGDAVRVGSRRFEGGSVYPIPKGRGWRFVTPTGLWDADTFLAPPRLVAWGTGGRIGVGTGRLVQVDHGAIVGASLPDLIVVDAAFSDDTRGVAIVEPGVVLLTRDGGATWAPTGRMPGEVPRGVVATESRRWAFGERQALSIAPDGTTALVPVTAVPRIVAPTEALRALRDGAVRQARREVTLGIEHFVGFADPVRRGVIVERSPPDGGRPELVEYDLVDERVVGVLSTPEFCNRPDLVLGDVLHVLCDRGGEGITLYRRGAGSAWEPRMQVASCGGAPRCVVSPDGARIACTGRCDPAEHCGVGLTLCERDASGARATRSVGASADGWELAGYDGDALILVDSRRALRHARVVRGAAAPQPLVRGIDLGSPWTIERRAFGRDGRMRLLLGRLDGARREVWEGFAGEDFEAITPPASARSEGGNLALCNGDGDLVAVARDGVPWVRPRGRGAWVEALPREGPLAFLRGTLEQEAAPSCTELGLRIGTRWDAITVLGWGPLTAGVRESLGVHALWGAPGSLDPHFECASERGATDATDDGGGPFGPGLVGRLAPASPDPLYRRDAVVRSVEPWSDPPDAVTVNLAAPGIVGFAELDGFRGYARIRGDGSVLAGPLGALPHVVAHATRWTPCAGAPRGELVFDADVFVDGRGARNAFGAVRMGIEGDALCVLGVVSLHGAWRVGAAADDAAATVRCTRRPDLDER